MVPVFSLTCVLLLHLPLFHSNTLTPICPKNFSCGGFGPLEYPFYNSDDTRCGLVKLNCTKHSGEIQLGDGHSYQIIREVWNNTFLIHNKTFQQLLENQSCEALMNNFTSPEPLLYSFYIQPFITLFKCTNDPMYATEMEAYFKQKHNDYWNKSCRYHNFYYNKYSASSTEIPADLPQRCDVIKLPVQLQNEGNTPDGNDIFSLLTSEFSLTVGLSPLCDKCTKEEGRCQSRNETFQCVDANEGPSMTVYSLSPVTGPTMPPALAPDVVPAPPVHNAAAANSPLPLQFPLPPPEPGKSSHKLQTLIAAVASIAFLTIVNAIIVCFIWTVNAIIVCFIRKFKRKRINNNVNVETFLKNQQLALKRFSYSEIKKMTNCFKVKLGEGGYGSVYKGALTNGNLVAVKVLTGSKGNGEDFINEVASVGRTSHKNIVSLLGFSVEENQRALIYEFMPNGSLERFIYGRATLSDCQLGWEKLHEIAIGIAEGLEYLHTGCNTQILHFDIKPHNILLDEDFRPKISDFGLAKLFPEKRSMLSMSRARGTPGYIAPELNSRNLGGISQKSDVYSYGMMILEMVGGRKNIDTRVDRISEIYFPDWIYKKVEQDEEFGLDGIVCEEENEIARKMIIVGLWCIQTHPSSRPTITKVLSMLEGDSQLLEVPPKPKLSSPSRSVDS